MRATAPGKLMLIGEYAVLEGAPAIVAAVDRRVEVVLGEGGDLTPSPVVTIRTDLPGEASVELDISEPCTPDHFPHGVCFVRSIVGAALGDEQEAEQLARLGSIEVHSEALRSGPGGAKLGLGSSAAVAAALTTALAAWTTPEHPVDPAVLLARARAAHREAVGGSGSGVDVAASMLGGVRAFRITPTGLEHHAVRLPQGLEVLPVWTGEAVDTADFLAAVRAFARAEPEAYAIVMGGLREVALHAVRACGNDDLTGFLDAVDVYRRGMQDLGDRAGLPIVSAPHQQVAEIAAAHGAVAKPSGAGGGDVAVVFVPEDADRTELCARLEREGFPLVSASITSAGAGVETLTRLST
ncbi:MAG: hypothetical protein QNJ98_10820 [Planctomycetota bacterium]|nr:hypothetical protein [Planctomycetota bacterium]